MEFIIRCDFISGEEEDDYNFRRILVEGTKGEPKCHGLHTKLPFKVISPSFSSRQIKEKVEQHEHILLLK